MAGGSEAAFERVKPLLELMGKNSSARAIGVSLPNTASTRSVRMATEFLAARTFFPLRTQT